MNPTTLRLLVVSALGVAASAGSARADGSAQAAKLGACFKGDAKACSDAGASDDYGKLASMAQRCGAKIAVRVEPALIDELVKHNNGPVGDAGSVFDGIGELCEDPVRVGSKQDIATRLKSIHLVLIPAPPPNAGGARVPSFKFDGSELTVGMFYGPSNVKDETFGWVFRNVAYDANVRTRVAMYSHCYAGDTDPCLQASLGQVEQGATVVRAACGAAPAIAVDEILLREHDKSNISVAALIDGTLAALTSSVCKTPAGKAKFARIKTMRFTYASGAAPKGRAGEPTISFRRQGDDVVVTDYAGTANVDDATTTWAQKNL